MCTTYGPCHTAYCDAMTEIHAALTTLAGVKFLATSGPVSLLDEGSKVIATRLKTEVKDLMVEVLTVLETKICEREGEMIGPSWYELSDVVVELMRELAYRMEKDVNLLKVENPLVYEPAPEH